MSANELTKEAIEYLELHGYVVWRTNAGYVRSNVKLAPAGTPDIIGFGPDGRFVGFEVKDGNDKVRPSQLAWLKTASAHNCFTRIIRTKKDVEQAVLDYDEPVTW